MLKFKSNVELAGEQQNWRDQHHWESRAAHIFNTLWEQVLEKLPPLPDLPGIEIDTVVPVEYCEPEGAHGINNISFAISQGYPVNGGKADLIAKIPHIENEQFDHSDLDMFRHELIHCYQFFHELREDLDYCEAHSIKIGGPEYTEYRRKINIANHHKYEMFNRYSANLHKAYMKLYAQRADQYFQHSHDISHFLKSILLPFMVAKSRKLYQRYCYHFRFEHDMVVQAGQVWTPDLSYDDNLMIYHTPLSNVFEGIRANYKAYTGRQGTRQQLEKLGAIQSILSNISSDPAFQSAKMKHKLSMMLKNQYNFVERSEQQLAA